MNTSTCLSMKQVSIEHKMVIVTFALLKTSFLASQSKLIFEPSTHTKFFSVYLMAFSHFLSIFFFITLFIFFSALSTSFTVFLIFDINSSTSRTLSVDFSLSLYKCLGAFLDLQRMGTFLYLNITYYYE